MESSISMTAQLSQISHWARQIVDADKVKEAVERAAQGKLEQTSGGSGKRRMKYRRSQNGCMNCRRQKIKCDEMMPVCLRCAGSARNCEYAEDRELSGQKRQRRSTQASSSPSEPRANAPSTPSQIVETPVAAASQPIQAALQSLSGGPLPLPTLGAGPSGISPSSFDFAGFLFPGSSPSSAVSPSYQLQSPQNFLNNILTFENLPQANLPTPSASSQAAAASPATARSDSTIMLNMKSSKVLRRRANGIGADVADLLTPPTTFTRTSQRQLLIDRIVQEIETDYVLFEFGPSRRTDNSGNHSDQLANALPSPIAKALFHYYCNVASPFLTTMGNSGQNPLLHLCTPWNLFDTMCPASTAVRMSILSISAAYLAHETSQSSFAAEISPQWPEQKRTVIEMGIKFKHAALSNIFLADTNTASTVQHDRMLAACTLICIRDVITADPTWDENLDFILSFICRKGGAAALLQGPQYSFTRRYLLEELAVHSVFSSFITGKIPLIMDGTDSWWHDGLMLSTRDWEWESVEGSFGMTRAMIGFIAKAVCVDARKRRLRVSLKEGGPEELRHVRSQLMTEAESLLVELDIWGSQLHYIPRHPRIACGDYIYKYTAKVFILADIMEKPITIPAIGKSIDAILELCSEVSAMRMSVMLIWPLLIAGVFGGMERREKVISLFEAFRSDYCEDLPAALALLQEQWRRMDAGEAKVPWNELTMASGQTPLLI